MKIFLIEDDRNIRERLGASFSDCSLTVVEAGDENGIMDRLKNGSPFVVVAAINDGSGGTANACKAIRCKTSPDKVFVVAAASEDAVFSFDEDGAADVADCILREPISDAELAGVVRSGIRILTLEDRLREAEIQVRTLSVTDPLTGCFTRRYLVEHLPHEVKRALRYGRSLSILVCDIDRLEAINGVWGGGMGDRVLSELGKLLQASVRRNIDWVARDEEDGFAIVLPETEVEGGCALADRLRGRINEHRWDREGPEVRVTASFGVAGFSAQWERTQEVEAEHLLSEAKNYLRICQREGLNRIAGGTLEEGMCVLETG